MLLSLTCCLGSPGEGANTDPGLFPVLMSPGACGSSCPLQFYKAHHRGQSRCHVFSEWLLPHRYGWHLKRLWGSREGVFRFETLALHACTLVATESRIWDPSVGSNIPESHGSSQRGVITWSTAIGARRQDMVSRAKPLCVCPTCSQVCAHLHTPCSHGWCGQ